MTKEELSVTQSNQTSAAMDVDVTNINRNHFLSITYISRQKEQRPWDQRNDPIMVGDLPLKQWAYLRNVLDAETSSSTDNVHRRILRGMFNPQKAQRLEHLQILLHIEGQEESEVVIDGHSSNSRRGYSHGYDLIPFHEEIRANWEQFARAVGENDQLEEFEISDVAIPPAPFFADKMAPSLEKGSLVRLDLIGCNLTEFESVAKLLNKGPSLISLGLSCNKISEVADAKHLSAAMAKHKVLSFVDLSKCGLNNRNDVLSLLLKGCKKLSGLDLGGNGFDSKSLALIAKFLSTHKSITILNVEGSEFDKKSVTTFNKAVEKNNTLEQLSLVSTGITLSTKIQRSLVLNDKLLHIDLRGNKLGKNGSKFIVKHLKKNPPLSILSLVGCGLSSKGAEGLCNALKRNINLAHLDLRGNDFNDTSVPFFVDALRNNSTLLTLQMSGNNMKIKSGRKELIKGALCDPTSLQSIAESNHTCLVTLNNGTNGNKVTHENEFRKINMLENEGQKIRYKVIVSLFTLKTVAFNPRDFQHIPLGLMPRLLELVQQQMGYGKYGREVWKAPIRKKGSNPRLTRVYEVIHSWSMMPSLFAVSCSSFLLAFISARPNIFFNHFISLQRGPGKKKRKAAKKRKHVFAFKEADDEEWTPKGRN